MKTLLRVVEFRERDNPFEKYIPFLADLWSMVHRGGNPMILIVNAVVRRNSMNHRLFKTITFAFVWLSVAVANATHQELDRVVIDGENYYFIESPMAEYWNETKHRPRFDLVSSSNWKGYTATWEIRDGRLLLASFAAYVDGKPIDAFKMLGSAFPTEATWLSGPLHAVNNVQFSNVTRYSDNAKRFYFIDGVLKKTLILDRVECCSGRLGISLGNRNGRTVIKAITPGSPAAKSLRLEVNDIVEAFTDLDGETIPIGKVDSHVAGQLLRGLVKQPVKIRIRREPTERVIDVELKRVLSFERKLDRIIDAAN